MIKSPEIPLLPYKNRKLFFSPKPFPLTPL